MYQGKALYLIWLLEFAAPAHSITINVKVSNRIGEGPWYDCVGGLVSNY